MLNEQERILLKAQGHNWPMVVAGGEVVSGEGGWRRVAKLPALHASLAAQLEQAAEREGEVEAREARWADDDRRRDEGRRPDPAAAGQFLIEAEASRQEFERGRPARMEALLEGILAEMKLQRQAK